MSLIRTEGGLRNLFSCMGGYRVLNPREFSMVISYVGEQAMDLRGFRASVNPRFQGGIPDFMDGIQGFMDNFNTF